MASDTATSAAPRRARRRMRATAVLYAVTGVVFATFLLSTVPGMRPDAGYNLVLDGLLNNIAYELSAAVCLVRARRMTTHRGGYEVLGWGLALYGVGNIYWTLVVRTMDPEPFPTIADAFWLSFYPFAFAALVMFAGGIVRKVPLSLWLDALVAGLAVAGIAAAAFDPVLAVTGGSRAAVATTLAYLLLDLLLLLVVTAVLAVFNWRAPTGLLFVAAGLALFAIADGLYLFTANSGSYQSGGPGDGLWVAATLTLGFSPGWAKRPDRGLPPVWVRIGLPVGAALGALATLDLSLDRQLNQVAVSLCVLTVVAALARLVVTLREVASLAGSHELAFTDELTGLGNRRAFYDGAAERIDRPGGTGALLLLDLDRFKEVNDSLGHRAGDALLVQVTERLRDRLLDTAHLLVRLGGDEFAVLVDDADDGAAQDTAHAVRDAFRDPFSLEGITVRLTASIGIALYPCHGADASTLLRRADLAMYQAKAGRAGHLIYSEDLDSGHNEQRLHDLEALRGDIADRSMVIHYQPKVDVATNRVTGVEALVRWEHPTRGLLLPGDFLSLVEQAGLMGDLTDAVLDQALDQVCSWRTRGRWLSVAVNLSASSLVDVDLPTRVCAALTKRRLAPSALALEITEDFLMADRERARDILSEVRRSGVQVSVDDYGTGYSSLAYLRELPIDELKLDRSFITPMTNDPRAAAIVRSTIDLAHALGLTMVAEGVECDDVVSQLAAYGCDKIQGFVYAPALAPAELEQWLDARESSTARRVDAPAGLTF